MLCAVFSQVPISLVYRKGLAKKDGSDHMLLHGYGSYEYPYDPRCGRCVCGCASHMLHGHMWHVTRKGPRLLVGWWLWSEACPYGLHWQCSGCGEGCQMH